MPATPPGRRNGLQQLEASKAQAAIACDSFGALVCIRLTSAKASRGEKRSDDWQSHVSKPSLDPDGMDCRSEGLGGRQRAKVSSAHRIDAQASCKSDKSARAWQIDAKISIEEQVP